MSLNVFSIEKVMKDRDYNVLDEGYIGKVYDCTIDGKNYRDVHTDGLETAENQNSTYETTWKNCQKNGKYKAFRSGFLTKEGFYKDDQKHGEWTSYDESTGNKTEVENFKNDEWNGLRIEFYKGTEIVYLETYYTNREKNGLQKMYNRSGKLTSVESYLKGELHGESVYYKSLKNLPMHIEESDIFSFYHVMGPSSTYYGPAEESGRWRYVNCGGSKLEESLRCRYEKDGKYYNREKDVYVENDIPFMIKTTYQQGIRHGSLEISDPNDGHVYTTVEYFRGGKLGEDKITNKQGLTIYSVNCLKGGAEYSDGYLYSDWNYAAGCRKDGEETVYRRSPFTKNQDWFLYASRTYQDDEVIREKYFRDPNKKNELIWNGNIVLPLVLDESKIVQDKSTSSSSNPIQKEVDKIKKDLNKLKKLNPFRKKD